MMRPEELFQCPVCQKALTKLTKDPNFATSVSFVSPKPPFKPEPKRNSGPSTQRGVRRQTGFPADQGKRLA